MERWFWLRMAKAAEYAPSCEAAYAAHHDLMDAIVPVNGGRLSASGDWKHRPWLTDNPFAVQVRSHEGGYYPLIGNDRPDIQTVLDDPALIDKAATGLGAYLESRDDRDRIDGVMLDFEGVPSAQKDRLTLLFERCYRVLHDMGLTVVASVRSHDGSGQDYDDAYAYDYDQIRQNCDLIEARQYGYWKPLPRYIDPLWWIERSLELLLEHGVAPGRVLLGVGTMAHWHGIGDDGDRVQVTTEFARRLVGRRHYVHSDRHGIVSAEIGYADTGGYAYLTSGDTLARRVELAKRYGLKGVSVFLPGNCADDHWAALQ